MWTPSPPAVVFTDWRWVGNDESVYGVDHTEDGYSVVVIGRTVLDTSEDAVLVAPVTVSVVVPSPPPW